MIIWKYMKICTKSLHTCPCAVTFIVLELPMSTISVAASWPPVTLSALSCFAGLEEVWCNNSCESVWDHLWQNPPGEGRDYSHGKALPTQFTVQTRGTLAWCGAYFTHIWQCKSFDWTFGNMLSCPDLVCLTETHRNGFEIEFGRFYKVTAAVLESCLFVLQLWGSTCMSRKQSLK